MISIFVFMFVSNTVKLVHSDFRLQILHCNDLHSRFMETDTYGTSCPDNFAKDGKCFGGFARLKGAAMKAIEEANKQNLSSVFLNAGDTFQGTSFYSTYKWKICADLMSKMGFDVMTIGNHEFDDGIDNLVNFLKNVKTPTVCSNLNLDSEPRLKIPSLTTSFVMPINDKKIGFIGYLTPSTKQISSTENLEIYPEIPYIRNEAKRMKANGINIIIALGHSGITQDLIIAQEVEEISLIVGGHSHTLLYTPQDKPPSTENAYYPYPTWVTQKSGKKIPIVQAYANSKYLGKLVAEFDSNGNVVSAIGNSILLDGTIKKDPNMEKAVSVWAKTILEKLKVVKGYTRTFLEKPNFSEGVFECTLGNFITDALIDLGVKYSAEKNFKSWTIGSISFYHNGGIRAKIDNKKNKGAITLEDIMTIAPFGNKVMLITLRGKTIRKILEYNVHNYSPQNSNVYQVYVHFSGLRVIYDLNRQVGNRVKSLEVLCTDCNIPKFTLLENEAIYRVFTVSYLAAGGSGFKMIPKETINSTVSEWTDFECLSMYIEKNTIIYPKIDNRVVVQGFLDNKKLSNSTTCAVKVPNLILILNVFIIHLIKN